MKIAITGPHKDAVISKIENSFNVKAKKPWGEGIVDIAAETYKYDDERIVLIDGSPFDSLATPTNDEGYAAVYEQIALDALENLDYIVVVTMDIDKTILKVYEDYAAILPTKFYFCSNYTDFELAMR